MAQLSEKFYNMTEKLRDKGYEVHARTEHNGTHIHITVNDLQDNSEPLDFFSRKPHDEAFSDFVQDLKEVFDFGDESIDRMEFNAEFDRRAAAQEERRKKDPSWNPATIERAHRLADEALANNQQRVEFIKLTRDIAREILWNHMRASEERGYGVDADLKALVQNDDAFFGQRKYSDRHGKSLIEAMERLEWKLSPQGVSIARDGFLIDGQHRVTSVAVSAIPVAMKVTYNVPDEVFPVVDTGKGRSAGDILAMLKVKNATHVATVIRLLYNYDNFRNPADWFVKSMTNEQIYKQLLENYITLPDAYNYARSLHQSRSSKTYLSLTAMGAAQYIITRAWPDGPIKEFWTNVQGRNIDPYWHGRYKVEDYDNNPGHALHRWAMSEDAKAKAGTSKRPSGQMRNVRELLMILTAWNEINENVVRQRYHWKTFTEAPQPYKPS